MEELRMLVDAVEAIEDGMASAVIARMYGPNYNRMADDVAALTALLAGVTS
jgi:hypothetical protein